MKIVEEQLDDMLPEDVRRQRRRAAARAEHFKSVAAGLRELGRAGVTVEQAAKNLNAAVAKARNENLM